MRDPLYTLAPRGNDFCKAESNSQGGRRYGSVPLLGAFAPTFHGVRAIQDRQASPETPAPGEPQRIVARCELRGRTTVLAVIGTTRPTLARALTIQGHPLRTIFWLLLRGCPEDRVTIQVDPLACGTSR